MLLVNALKAVCDLLLCFSFAALIASYSEAWLLMGSVLALAFLSSLFLQKSGGGVPARLFCGLLPALGLFAAQSGAQGLITAVVLSVHFVLTMARKNEIHYEDYKYWFGIPAIPVAAVFIICLTQWPIRPAATICSGAYLFLGVLVLREKRIGAGAGWKLRLMNAAEPTGAVLVSVMGSALVLLLLRLLADFLEVLLQPFAYVLKMLIYLLTLFGGRLVSAQPEETPTPTPTEPVYQDQQAQAQALLPEPTVEPDLSWVEVLARVVVVVLALALLAFLLYRLYILLRKVRPEDADAAPFEEGEAEPLLFRRGRRRRRKISRPSNNERVRQLYKEYLFYVRTCGVEIVRHTTSEDVLTAAGSLAAPGEAERLRDLYIRARYHDSEEMSDAEVEEANALLTRIREHFEARRTDSGIPNAD